ncbi:MAG: BON domain-containing protein [bacterium JZ-2024 1]
MKRSAQLLRSATTILIVIATINALPGCTLIKDITLTRKVVAEMKKDATLGYLMENGDLQVNVNKGVVIIGGHACEQATLDFAKQVAEKVPGVKGVEVRAGVKDCDSGAANPLFLNPYD